ncbi:Mitochondrial distribution and morphology 31 [Lecanosticta acicola]|uniref:Mitochondrial distribution and morphology 31 n=1 Tax=Lecanosticta acicola TaxID=111012 RepID=A0AAI9E7U6_9PEZI|nr:Mitochondrial distribution and morphology 31 [Lecanosticta acicola]
MRWVVQRRCNSSDNKSLDRKILDEKKLPSSEIGKEPASTDVPHHHHSNKSLYDRLPHLHRPTKEELLSAATGFWHRLQIRFKWFSIRSVRPFNLEEIFAFASWIFWGHVLWFVIGTTTFISLVILAANTVLAQETLAGWVGNYLTRSTGLKVIFESAIVPRWGDGVIRLNKVFVSRRPATNKKERSVSKGSSTTAAAAAEAHALAEKEKQQSGQFLMDSSAEQEDDGNYTQFDVTIENVEVTLSFTKWFNGKGLLRDVAIRGVRGVLDRTSVQPRDESIDPKSYRHEHNTGDFEMDSFKMEDVLLTVYQPNNFRPFQVSVYNCELPRLRKQWLFYDFLCANTAHGSFDNSLFTIHHRQVHGTTGVALVDGHEEEASQWKKHSRLRIDDLKIDHLNRGVEGPFSWIHEGNVDIVADIMIPNDADGSIAKVMSDFYDRMEATVISQAHVVRHQTSGDIINNDQQSLSDTHEQQQQQQQHQIQPQGPSREEDTRFLVFDIQIHLNDVRASVPLFTKDLSYVNNAVVRPIVAYINSHAHGNKNYIPISCRIVKRLGEFDGSWTVFDSGLLDDLSRETYDAFVRDIMDRKSRQRRMKKVGLWAASVAAQALFIGLAGQLA